MRQNHISVPATDMEASKTFFVQLGLRQIVDHPPDYARFLCPDGEQTLSLERVDDVSEPQHIVVYFECEDLDRLVASLTAKGLTFESGAEDQPWGWREAYLKDPCGPYICFYYAGRQRTRLNRTVE